MSIYDYGVFYILVAEYKGLHQSIPYVFDTMEGAEKSYNTYATECIYKVEQGFTSLCSYHHPNEEWVHCSNDYPFLEERTL